MSPVIEQQATRVLISSDIKALYAYTGSKAEGIRIIDTANDMQTPKISRPFHAMNCASTDFKTSLKLSDTKIQR